MAEVSVKITETLSRTIFISGAKIIDALDAVKEDYKKAEIVLDSGDFVDVTFSAEAIEEVCKTENTK